MAAKKTTATAPAAPPPAASRIDVPLDKIRDNPYNVRNYCNPVKIGELADSILQVSLLQVPDARPMPDGTYELAFGHMRYRAYKKLHEKNYPGVRDPEKYATMPLNVREMTDADMFYYSVEENLKRTDVKPLEVARCVENFFTVFPDTTETDVAKKLSMSQPHVANMRRVLTLPQYALDKINEDIINFSMGRELLVLNGLTTPRGDSLEMMKDAMSGLKLGNKNYGEPVTVDGIKKCIDSTAGRFFKFLTGETSVGECPGWNFKTGDCKDCEKKIKTWETKSQSHTWCVDVPCWEKHQADFKAQAAAAAKKRMQEEAIARVAAAEKARQEREAAKVDEKPASKAEVVQSIVETPNPKAKKVDDKTDEKQVESSTQADEPIPQGIPTAEEIAAIATKAGLPKEWPCWKCLNITNCDRTTASSRNGHIVCENLVTDKSLSKITKKATTELPEGIMQMVSGEMGSRAEILDLKDLRMGYGLKSGFLRLDESDSSYSYMKPEDRPQPYLGQDKGFTVLDTLADPAECVERCIKGFHFAYDSTPLRSWEIREGKENEPKLCFVCTDTKCCSMKKGALTRARNAQGIAKKRGEFAAINQAADKSTEFSVPALKVIWSYILEKTGNYYGERATASKSWLAKRLGLEKYTKEDAFKALAGIDTVEGLLQPLVGYCLMEFTYDGEVKNYQIRTKKTLETFGVEIVVKEPEKGDTDVQETTESTVPVHG